MSEATAAGAARRSTSTGFQADWDQLQTYKPKALVGSGVVLVWTKYLK